VLVEEGKKRRGKMALAMRTVCGRFYNASMLAAHKELSQLFRVIVQLAVLVLDVLQDIGTHLTD